MGHINYVIISPSDWQGNGLRFRRHRLCDRLLIHKDTSSILWIYPNVNDNMENYSISSKLTCIGLPRSTNISKIIENELNDIKKQGPKIIWYTCPIYPNFLDDCVWDCTVYDCSDMWYKPWNLNDRKEVLRRAYWKHNEQKIINKCDILFSSSDYLTAHIKTIADKPVITIENGVEFDLFNTNGLDDKIEYIPSPRLGFVGGLKGKIDFVLLSQVAEAVPNYSIVLIGPDDGTSSDLKTLLRNRNVYYLGAVKYYEVPFYMKSLDVGLLPYRDIDYNKAVSPLKLFEYLAAGIPIVGCGLPTTSKYHKEGVYCYTEGDKDSFIEGCQLALSWKNGMYKETRIEIAKNHDWNDKLDSMIGVVLNQIS